MIPESAKPSVKQLPEKSEHSSDRKKSRLASKSSFATHKTKPETLPKSSRCPSPPEVSPRFRTDRPKEGNHNRLRSEFTPRYPANQASQGVQDFIKQVSRFIEKKNPFNEMPDPIKSDDVRKNHLSRDGPRILNSDKSSATSKKCREQLRVLEKTKRISERTQMSKSRTIITAERGGGQRESLKSQPEVRKVKDGGCVGDSIGSGRELRGKPAAKVVGSGSRFEGWCNAESPCSPPHVRSSQSKRSGRSEIPLRKTRTDMSKNPKPVSLLMQKPLKEIESTISIDFYSKKPFTPIEELSLCSEMQSPNANASSEKLNHVGKKNSTRAIRKDVLLEEPSNGFKLDRCFKSSNIPVDVIPSYSDVTDQKLCTAKRSKILDLDKVRTSSFTVLQNSREALCRLESLHQQNVSSKENVFAEKLSPSKLKMLTPKSSFNCLRGKGSKKNLSIRLSSKGNKPALKIKAKKSKKDIDENLMSVKKPQKATAKPLQLDTLQQATAPPDIGCFIPQVWNDEGLFGGKPDGNDSGSTSSGDHKDIAAGEESRMPVRATELDELEEAQRHSSKKPDKHFDDGGTDESKSKEKTEFPAITLHPPESTALESSPEDRQTDEDERSSSKTVTLEKTRMDEVSSVSSEDSRKAPNGSENVGLSVKGTSLKFGKDEPPERPEDLEPKKNKLHIKINLTAPEDTDTEELPNNTECLDRLHLSADDHVEEQPPNEGGSSEVADEKEDDVKDARLLSRESPEKAQFLPSIQKSRKTSPFLRSRLQYKVSGANLKGVRKKKIRSDAGDRRLPSANGFFKSVTFQNKMKLDTKLRSGLTKAYNREEKRDLFDENVPIKLKRRNSEPISFRGYIWKRADSVTPRSHKASVSSMASSLKHLNTDDIDDFIFWEAVPQKMTACWEMSLYHSKRPWSVLSCSVFEDNRQSSTPGLILENLRNGGSLGSRRSPLNTNERARHPKENPFDVEPSIAQKNIDIKNWLAALNFPMPPSTSVDVISEGSFSTQSSVDAQNLTKAQVNQKRRKVLASLRFSEETPEKKADEKESKYQKSTKWTGGEVGGLMDLIRRKSGGFVTNEQFLTSEHSIHRPNVTVNLCLYSKMGEEKPVLREVNERNVSSEPKTFKTGSKSSPEVEKPTQGDEVERRVVQEVAEGQKFCWRQALERELRSLPSNLNIWKYLFLITLLIISVHYCFLNNNVGRS